MTPALVLLIGLLLMLLFPAAAKASAFFTSSGPAPSPQIDGIIALVAAHRGISKRLMLAIAWVESKFDPNAVNKETEADLRKGRDVDSIGLFQILFPDTAQALRPGIARELLFNPAVNADLAGELLAELLSRFPRRDDLGFPADAVAAYNAGKPRFSPDGKYTNQTYVDRVKLAWHSFAGT